MSAVRLCGARPRGRGVRRRVFPVAVAVLAAAAHRTVTANAAPPILGAAGLRSATAALAHYIQSTYPGVVSIGGVRPDPLPDHPSGRAIDIMIGSDMGLGDVIAADIQAQSARFGVSYMLWRVPAHFDHIHVTVN